MKIMKTISSISRYFVGILFIFSGLIKVNDPMGTAIKLEEYFEVFAHDFSPIFLKVIPAVLTLSVIFSVMEVVLGIAVLFAYRMRITTVLLLLLIIFFTFLTFYSAYFNKVTDCGCFGDAIKLTPWQSFWKDIVLLILSFFLFGYRKRFNPLFNRKIGDILIASSLLINIFLAIYALEHLPYIDFRPYKIGADIPKLMQPSGQLKYKYVMEKDGQLHEFENYPTDTTFIFKEMIVENPEVQPKITDYYVWNDEGDYTQQTFEGNKLMLITYNANKANAKNMGEINLLISQLEGKVESIALSGSSEPDFETFRHENQLAVPYFFTDGTVLKAIMRSNPGLMLMQNGVVKGKWHYNDVPSTDEVLNLLQ